MAAPANSIIGLATRASARESALDADDAFALKSARSVFPTLLLLSSEGFVSGFVSGTASGLLADSV